MSTPINTRDLRLQATSPRVLLVGTNYINLTTPTLQFKYGSNNVAQPTQTVVTATPVGALNGQTVTFTYTGLTSAPTISGNTLTVVADNITNDVATVTASLSFQGVNYSNTITLTKIYNQLVVSIQRPLDLISTASDGTGYVLPSTANYVELYNGVVKDTTGVVYGPASTTKSGLTVAVNTTTGEITVSGTSWTSTGESFLLTATKNSVTYSTTYTITKAKTGSAGSSARIVNLTTTQQAFAYDSAGANPTGTATITATVQNATGTVYYEFLKNSVSVQNTTTNTYSYSPQTSYTSMPDIIEVRVREGASSGTVLAYDILSLYGIKPGAAGANAVSGFLTNEAAVVAADSTGTVSSFTGTGGTFKVYDGITDKTGTTGASGVTYSVVSGSAVGVTISIAATGVYTITAMSTDTGYATLRAVYGSVTIDKVYSISKSKAGTKGDNATAYWLVTSASAIQKNTAGTFNPTTLTVYGYSAVGTNAPALYSGRFKIYENGSATASYSSDTLSTDENTKTYTPSSSSVTSIKVEFYLAGGTTTKLDEQTIPVVSDGAAGVNAITGLLSNTTATVPADSSGTVSTFAGASTTMYIYNGATDDSANWTYSVTYTSCTATATNSNRTQTVTALSADTGYITFTASRSGYSSIIQIFTITKAKAGATGGVGAASFLIDRLTSGTSTEPTTSELSTAIGRNYPVQGDLATITYNNKQSTISYKYSLISTTLQWVQQVAWITGDLIVSGGINASKISGGTITSTDTNFGINIGNYAYWNPDAGYASVGISIKRNVSNFPTISVASLTAGYLYQVVSLGTTTNWLAIGNVSNPAVGSYFAATGVAGNGSGTVKRVLSSALSIYDAATWDTAAGPFTAKFHPSLNIQSEYSSALRISSYAGYNNFANIVAASINGGSYRTLEVAAMSGLAQDCTLAVLNGYGNSIGAKIIAGGASFTSMYVENISGSNGTAVYGIGSIEATGKLISTAAVASTSTTSGSLLVIGGAGISGAVYAGSLYDNGNRVLTTNTLANIVSITNATVATSTTTGALVVTGGVGITGKVWVNDAINSYANITAYYSSDARLKENIKTIKDPIKMIDQISGVYFDWTDDYIDKNGGEDGYFIRKHDIGVIAQEVEAVLPEIVATRADGYKAVIYEKLIPLIIEAIKELDRRTK